MYAKDWNEKRIAHLSKIDPEKRLSHGYTKQLALALFACVVGTSYAWAKDKRTYWEREHALAMLIGDKPLDKTFVGGHGALNMLLSDVSASAYENIWAGCWAYPYSTGYPRRSFRSRQRPMLYLPRNMSILREMVYAEAEGPIDLAKCISDGPSESGAYGFVGPMLAAAIDAGDRALLQLACKQIYEDGGKVSRGLIDGLLKSHSAEAHTMVGELLVAARLQEGLRQAIVESMDFGSREGFLSLLDVIIERDMARFSSVARALGTWTGLGLPPDRPRLIARCLELVRECLTDKSAIAAHLDSDDPLHIYMALWAIGFDEIEDIKLPIRELLGSGQRHKRLVALCFLSETHSFDLANELVLPMLSPDRDKEELAWALASLFSDRDTTCNDISPELDLPPHTTPAQVYRALEALLPLFTGKACAFKPSVFPWAQIKMATSDILARMLLCAQHVDDPALVDGLIPQMTRMDPTDRSRLVELMLERQGSDDQKRACVQALGDKSAYVRTCAMQGMKVLTLGERDCRIIEQQLQYKAGDLRNNCLALLMKRAPEQLLSSIQRLAQSGDEHRRLAAIELASEVRGDARFADIRQRADDAVQGIEGKTQAELIREGDARSNAASLGKDNGFGLYDASRAYQAQLAPTAADPRLKALLAPDVGWIERAYSALSELVHRHREYAYESTDWDGAVHTQLLGENPHVLIGFGSGQKSRRDISDYPLSEVWQAFAERENFTTPELMCLSISLMDSYQAMLPWNRAAFHEAHIGYSDADARRLQAFFRKLAYNGICQQVIELLLYARPAEEQFEAGYAVARLMYDSLPMERFAQICENPHKDGAARTSTWEFVGSFGFEQWLSKSYGQVDEDARFRRYFDLKHAFYRASAYHIHGPDILDFARAHQMGMISEDELLMELMCRRESPDAIGQISSVQPQIKARMAKYDKLPAIARRAIDRVVEIELTRGELPSPVTALASSLGSCFGAATFIAIVLRMDKNSFVRGYNSMWGSATKREVLSHLLKCCQPNPEDGVEALRSQLAGRELADSALVDAAMYAPKWAGAVQDYLGWPGLRSAVWYFHAHMNDTFGEEKQTVVARYSSIEPQDFKDGAFDIGWFWDTYNQLGAQRFQVAYASAKYVATAGQHKRAQLFADAVTGKLDISEAKEAIKDKRSKDHVLAYALIPIEGTRDVLERYERIQAFLREAKGFGAQRQASETAAGRVALTNLARNAGYHDANRLVWQMETEKLRDVEALFEPQALEDVSVHLAVGADGRAAIEVMKDGKPLKDIPAKLKKLPLALHLKEVHKQLLAQHSRARASLEAAMVARDEFELAEILGIGRNPVIAPLIRNLVFVAGESLGFFRMGALVAPLGMRQALDGDAKLRIAHPVDLLASGDWAAYQKALFEQRILQPFKQVFRELYRPNADELAEKVKSSRYAGHQVQPKRALALLKSRGWSVDYEEGLQKVCFNENIVVVLWAMADWFSPADVEPPTLEAMQFLDRKSGKILPVSEVPAVLFSEAMRDVDLVVSVAHAGGVDPEASLSTVEMRRDLVREMLELLGIVNVEIRDSIAFIRGSLGEYTVHLGSGTAHKMATGSVFIVPVHSQHRGRLFLPFMDDDPRTAEIISKIVLLAEDQKIKDPAILAQIGR